MADLQAMFPGQVAGSPATYRPDKVSTVERGLPSLNAAMVAGGINTPRRMAAFLTTLAFESLFEYDVHQFNDTREYAGRGYIQLTGSGNYLAAGSYLGIDLLSEPWQAQELEWSAKIALWYWNVNRHCNPLADLLQMGKVNRAIGYPIVTYTDGSTNDSRRCKVFARALAYLGGVIGPDEFITCNR